MTSILVTLVALLHLYFLYLEMFMWTKPMGMKAFGLTPQSAEQSKVLAANQGLYNGFLAAGLIWSVLDERPEVALTIRLFMLTCVIIAGIFGAYSTGNRKILFIQSLPATVALLSALAEG